MYPIVAKRALSETIKLMEVASPEMAQVAQAGQFVILRVDERGERVPLTIADYDPQRGTITIIFQEVGKSTERLGKLDAGAALRDFAGPLGAPFAVAQVGTAVCVGGGVGIAPVYPIAKALKAAGNRLISIIGARSEDLLILEDEMRAISDEFIVTTDDGTRGRKGFVSQPLEELLATRAEQIGLVVAIGPIPMMRSVVGVTKSYPTPTQVSLDPIMVDGTGMCGGCRVTVGGETKFACVDGPLFDGKLVDFGELASRRLRYQEMEKRSLELYRASCAEVEGCRCRQ
jgi:ferredoxin/flavodoxin---NADP+ reductase